ncbi:MAG TPA: M28 family peptidase [Pyrinomonadaceae bacterium]|nr:M28 family peptidase [Pyrinomonadaceae bacterium]
MRPSYRTEIPWRGFIAALLTLSLVAPAALAQQGGAATAAKPAAASSLTAAEREALARVRVETVREVATALSSKEMEGRGTAQPGGERAAKYLADRFAKLGLKPLGDAGTYLQAVKFKSAQVLPETSLKAGDATLKHGEDFVMPPPFTYDEADATGGVVFVGYGVTSEELKRDDLKGLDLKGKIVVALSGRPANVDAAVWQRANAQKVPALFMRGIAGLVIAGVGSPQQPFNVISNYLSRRQVGLASAPVPPMKLPPVLLASDAAAEKLFAGSGTTYAQALAKAQTGEATSRDLGREATLHVRVKREEGTGSNVVAVLEGSDAKLKEEAIVYSAHYDAYGINPAGVIFPGAADNALGTSMIVSIAEALSKTSPRPRRSVIFLAVTGEEYGLLGARHWVNNPTWPIEKVAANINHDSAGTEIYAPVKNLVGWGQEHSTLGPVFEGAVAATGNSVATDPLPEENIFVRSDHYEFVKKGVPALMMAGFPGGDQAPHLARLKKWMDTDYHSPRDVILPDWEWSGPQTVAQVGLLVGLRVANADAAPSWLPSSRFNKPRGAGAPAPPAN